MLRAANAVTVLRMEVLTVGLEEHLAALALANRHGWAFLAAYGLTWLACSWVWARRDRRTAAIATLCQGMVALPFAVLLTALTPGPPRPTHETIDALSVVLATGQLLGLPIVVFLVMSGRHTLVPLGMVALLVVHFAPYAWLYDTLLYAVMGGAISLSAVILMHRAERDGGPGPEVGAAWVCRSTGALLVMSAAVAAVL